MSITARHSANNPATRRSLRTPAGAAVSLLVLATLSAGFSAPAHAAETISFQYTGVIDATSVGGSAVTPVRVIYEFSPDLLPSGESNGVTFAEYGPLQKLIVELGDECVAMSGEQTLIRVFDDAGSTFVEDSYDVAAFAPAVTGKTLYGHDLDFVQFVLVDTDRTMFSSTALPTSVDFAASADYSQNLIGLIDPVRGRFKLLFSEGTPQLSTYDPAGTLAAIQADLTGLQLNAGVKTSLQNKLTKAGGYISGTSTKSYDKATQELRVFIAQVQGLSGQGIASGDAARLISGATNLIDQLPACT